MTITLIGGFRRPHDALRIVPGEAGDREEICQEIHIYLGPMRGSVTSREVFRRREKYGVVFFEYVGLRYPVDGVSLEEVAP